MKIVILIQAEPFYAPLILERIVEGKREDVAEIVGVTPINDGDLGKNITNYLHIFGLKEFILRGVEVAHYHLLDKLSSCYRFKRFYSIEGVAKHYGIKMYHSSDVNSGRFIEHISKINPDIIVSVGVTQILKKRLLDIPKRGSINVHSSLLPRYRGAFPGFWILLNGEKKTGVSVHYMNEKIDGGDIIEQLPFDINDDETFHSLYLKNARYGGKAVVSALKKISEDKVEIIRNDTCEAAYYSIPKRQDGIRFRKNRKYR